MGRLFARRRVPVIRERREDHPFYPHHVIRNAMVVLGAIAVLAALAGWFPAPMERMADTLSPLPPESGAAPMWLMRPAWMVDQLLPASSLTVLFFMAAFLLCALIPFLDRGGERPLAKRLWVAVPFLIWMVFILVSTWLLPAGVFVP